MAKFVKAPNINDEYTLPEVAGSAGQVLTMGTSGSTSWSNTQITGNVDGSGVTNMVAKFSDVDTVTDGSIEDDGTNVTFTNDIVLNNATGFTIESAGNLDIQSDSDGADNLNIGTSNEWKSINFETASYKVFTNNTERLHINNLGDAVFTEDVTANSFVKDGGTSSQFLKADGSVDSTTYATGTIPTNNTQLTNGAGYTTNTGTVDGTATAGYIPKMSDSNTITTSAIQEGTNDLIFGKAVSFSGAFGNLDTTADTGFRFETATTAQQRMRVDSDEFNIYFGGTSGAQETAEFKQSGEVRFKVNGSSKHLFQTDGDAHHDGDVIAYSTTISDKRLKDNVKTIENATDIVNNLRGVEYVWNSGSRKGQKEIGVIAQEVQKELPFLVREKTLLDGESRLTVDYEKLIGLLIEDAKAKDERIYKLEQKLNSL